MDSITPTRLAEALAALEPADRALLELSFRSRMPPEEVANVLGSRATAVVDRREAALAALADELGGQPGDPRIERALEEAGDDAWRPPSADPPPDAGEEPVASADPPPRRPLGSLKRRLILLGLAALALGIAAGILLATSDDESGDAEQDRGGAAAKSRAGTQGRRSRAPRRELGPVVELEQQIRGVDGEVAARLIRSGGRVRLALRARDLPKPAGNYEVWLLDAPRRALSLARFETKDFELDARLPADFAGYQQLDVTLELEDGNDDHSGASAFITPIESLAIK